MDPVVLAQDQELLLRGIMGFSISVIILVGSVWLLLSMILGARMGYLVMGSVLFAIMTLLSVIWVITAFGPRGPETTWFAVGVGEGLGEVSRHESTYDVSDYPRGDWVVPGEGELLADGEHDTATEADLVEPVLDTAVGKAIDPEAAPAAEEGEADPTESLEVADEVNLEAGSFSIVDIRVKEAQVEGEESLIAVGRAVPSELVRAASLGGGIEEGRVKEYLVEPGDDVAAGQALLVVETEAGDAEVTSEFTGTVIELGLRTPEQTGGEGDRVREGVPVAVLDVTGQPGAPDPVEVAAVRVRGSVRTPSVIYLAVSVLLFAAHLGLLNREEKARKQVAETATEAA